MNLARLCFVGFGDIKIYRGLKHLNVQIKSATVLVTMKFTGVSNNHSPPLLRCAVLVILKFTGVSNIIMVIRISFKF